MKHNLSVISRQYLAALQAYLKAEPQADLEPARELGRHAMSFGLETLDLARQLADANGIQVAAAMQKPLRGSAIEDGNREPVRLRSGRATCS